jgi:hypothetical protein
VSAVISDCGLYRYRLERPISDAPKTMAFIMVNPSTADAELDDPTIRRCKGFAQRHGVGRLIVGNKFAFRSTDVKGLGTAEDPIGPFNDHHLARIISAADYVIVAWGPLTKLPRRLRNHWTEVVLMAQRLDRFLFCLGTASDGQPRHPLMLPSNAPLIRWVAP